jgi:hypothetical protein
VDPVSCGTITGYAWNKDQPSTFLDVIVYDGNTALLPAIKANQMRTSLDPSGGGVRNTGTGSDAHGFVFPVPDSLKDGRPHSISVRFAASASTTLPLGTQVILNNSGQTLTCAPPSFQGALTAATCSGIGGWAKDASPVQPQSPLKVDLYDDKQFLSTAIANLLRPAIGPTVPGGKPLPADYSAFNYSLPSSLRDGQAHTIRANFSGTMTPLSASPMQFTAPVPGISGQPASLVACAATAAVFSVTASGSDLNYQWNKDGKPIAGATASTLTIGSVSAASAGTYTATVSNACGIAVSSKPADLAISSETAITVTRSPQNATVNAGQPVTFSVSASGSNLHYQWRGPDGGNIPGATGPIFTIPAVSAANQGSYYVLVFNGCSSTPSKSATLTVNGTAAAVNDARFVSQKNVTMTMKVGESPTVTITMKNAGTKTWNPGDGYRLVFTRPTDAATWGTGHVDLSATVLPGAEVPFTVPVKAPLAPGVYHFEWRMMQNMVGFGDFTPDLAISVIQ